jgi:hypothetical protein
LLSKTAKNKIKAIEIVPYGMKLNHLGANYFIKVIGEREDRLPGAAGLPFESADNRELSIVLRMTQEPLPLPKRIGAPLIRAPIAVR